MRRDSVRAIAWLILGLALGWLAQELRGGGNSGPPRDPVAAQGAEVSKPRGSHQELRAAPNADSSGPVAVESARVNKSEHRSAAHVPSQRLAKGDPALYAYYDIPTEEELEERYENYSERELVGASKGLDWALQQDTKALLTSMLERGQYRSEVLPAGKGPAQSTLRTPDGGHIFRRTQCVPLGGGTVEWRVAELVLEDYPILHARSLEGYWVKERLVTKHGFTDF